MADMNMDMMRMFADFRIPGMPDFDTLAAAQRRNIEALTAANRIALEGAQAVARRHMEILQASLTEMTDAVKTLGGQESPQAKAARQSDMMKVAYEKAVGNMRELAELIQKANSEAISLLNHRFTEAMDEVKTMVTKTA